MPQPSCYDGTTLARIIHEGSSQTSGGGSVEVFLAEDGSESDPAVR
jgi:hypothetical protein